jgi:Zn finger protein HypA/HybF involved in hydrogenase expression
MSDDDPTNANHLGSGWQRTDRPTQLRCQECGAFYITTTETANDCPVCSHTRFEIISAGGPPDVDVRSFHE